MSVKAHTRTPSAPVGHLKMRSTNAFTPPAWAMAPCNEKFIQQQT